VGMGMRRISGSSETGMGLNFSSQMNMDRVTGKYTRVGYENEESKIRPHPALLPFDHDTSLAKTQVLEPNPYVFTSYD